MKAPKVSILIVNYKNPELIQRCVSSILQYETELKFEIIVIDNHSEDESKSKIEALYPTVNWIECDYNSGFGRANNLGIKEANGEYILFINSDVVVVSPNTITSCLQQLSSLENSDRTILGTNLVNPDGSYQETLRLDFPGISRELNANPLYIIIIHRLLGRNTLQRKSEEQRLAHEKETYPAWINGAFLLVSRKQVEENQLHFDKDFFLYGEDMEWSWRANKNGMRFYHFPQLHLVHEGSASMPKEILKRSQIIVSDWLFHKKTRGSIYLFFVLWIVMHNLFMNGMLHFFAKLRGKKFTSAVTTEKEFRSIHWYLIRKYGIPLLFKKKLSLNKTFFTNCYQDETLLKKSK